MKERMPLKDHTRVIFMGNNFGLPTLDWLVNAKTTNGERQFDLVAIYTRAPKPTGRGLKVAYSPVHQAALELQKNYPLPFKILTPETFKDPKNVEEFLELHPDLVIVGSYGLILPEKMLDSVPMGCLNLHPSLLPEGRGPSPIQYAIWNGKQETGLSIMLITKGCDEGPVFIQERTTTAGKTTDDLCIELAKKAPNLLARVLYENMTPKEQDPSKATYTKKITRQEAQIDWDQPPEAICRKIFAFSSKPGAFSKIKDKELKIYKALALTPASHEALVNSYSDLATKQKLPEITPGTILQNHEKIVVACKDGSIELTELQLQSKNRISGKDFSHGRFLNIGDKFTKEDLSHLVKDRPTKNDSPQLKKKIARHYNSQKMTNPVWWRVLLKGLRFINSNENAKTQSGRE